MRRLLACFILFALVGAGGTLAARGDPQKRGRIVAGRMATAMRVG
jgi:hypothetical protein